MPRTFADQYFTKGAEFSKLVIYAYRPMASASRQSDGGYRVGSTIAMVLKANQAPIRVLSVTPILQFKGIPTPPQVQKNYLERTIGNQAYSAVAVTLFADEGDTIDADN